MISLPNETILKPSPKKETLLPWNVKLMKLLFKFHIKIGNKNRALTIIAKYKNGSLSLFLSKNRIYRPAPTHKKAAEYFESIAIPMNNPANIIAKLHRALLSGHSPYFLNSASCKK